MTGARRLGRSRELLVLVEAILDQISAALEREEQQATARLLETETRSNQARLDAQRALDRRDSIIERAASEGIDVEAISADELDSAEEATLQSTIESLKARMLRLGAINPLALEEYEESAERQSFPSNQIDDLRQAGATLRELISELEEAMRSRFTATFRAVAQEFEQRFPRLFGGGMASLHLTGDDEQEPSRNGRGYGVEIVARPPGKRPQNISLLSGGERALTAAALLLSILSVNPSPFCILDEVDAALDESNVGRFREALAELTDQTQFILVTHNRGTIEAADTIYGVSMAEDGSSKVLSLKVEEMLAQ